MPFDLFDAHNDTVLEIKKGEDFLNNSCEFNFERAKIYSSTTAVANICPASIAGDVWNVILKKLEFFKAQEELLIFKIIRSARDFGLEKRNIIIGIEGAEAVGKDFRRLYTLYQNGVRCMALTWNNINEVSDTNSQKGEEEGLTDFGKKLISRMEKIGMMVDVSHISEKGFWDVFECAKKPFIASHSNSKKICFVSRNLTDEQFLAIKSSGGVVGINYYTDFLNTNGDATIADVIKHIEHFMSLGGENNIGFGSDFDGVMGKLPLGIEGVEGHQKIIDELLKLNYSEDTVRKIAFNNFKRVFESVLQSK